MRCKWNWPGVSQASSNIALFYDEGDLLFSIDRNVWRGEPSAFEGHIAQQPCSEELPRLTE
jgi:hypothetical protein